MWWSQITYMIPSRRIMAKAFPCVSGARSQVRKRSAMAFSAGLSTLTPQSKARPSLCSDTPSGVSQDWPIPRSREPGKEWRSRLRRPTAPGLGVGSQMVWGS